jgi:monovalent cation:H+ antiporter, CPA1 family
MLSFFDIAALVLVLSAVFGWVNRRFIHLPNQIGLLILGLAMSLALVVADDVLPQSNFRDAFIAAIAQINFCDTMMNGMLAFLLFAGALHVDFSRLRSEALPVLLLATVGVLISTAIVGVATWGAAHLLGIGLPLVWALVFGALISPTDPVAVLSILKSVHLPPSMEIKITGESLFNDGVGVVVFTVLLSLALQGTGAEVSHGGSGFDVVYAGEVFLFEALGGAVFGILAGYISVHAMESIDEYPVEILITLALVTGLYAVALHLHTSGPIAVVVAGVFMGNRGRITAMSETTRTHLFQFWELIDELLNSVLFVLIALEVLVIDFKPELIVLALFAIPIVLIARYASVSGPILLLSLRRRFASGSVRIMVWGGLRGGISVALALSLPAGDYRGPILVATYGVVIFSIIVQGLTIAPLVRRLAGAEAPAEQSSH